MGVVISNRDKQLNESMYILRRMCCHATVCA